MEKQLIPDQDQLLCFIHQANIDVKKQHPRAAAFQNTPKEGDNLSCDWAALSTPEETQLRIGKQFKFGSTEFKNPYLYGVVEFEVHVIRHESPSAQQVEHDPIFNEIEKEGTPNNLAHSIIIGEKDEEMRLKMVDWAVWKIYPN